MASIIAKALQAHEVQLNQEREAEQQEDQAQKAALTRLLERVRPYYTGQLALVLDDELPALNWVPSGQDSTTFVDHNGTLEASVTRLEAELFGVRIVVTPVPSEHGFAFAVKPTSKGDNGPLEFTNLAEFGAAVRRHYPQVAADHGNN